MRDTIERMTGNVQAEHLALEGELVLVVPLVLWHLDGERRIAGVASRLARA